MSSVYLLPPLVSFVASIGLIFLCKYIFPKLKLMDRPADYGLTRKPIPYSVGIIFYIVILFAALFFVKITPIIVGVLVGGGIITIISFLDDRYRLSPWLRLAVQLIVAFTIVLAGVKIQIISNPFGSMPLQLDTISFTMFGQTIWLFSAIAIVGWLVLMMNVMNWIDGIPGLASGVSTIAQFSIFFLSLKQFHVVDQSAVITLSSVLAASTLAFLFFDFARPKILMGDTGSMFLGFMLGALSIIAGGKFATALLIMGFPVLDALWVIISRMLKGGSPLRGDYTHLHHQLLKAGFSPQKALFFNYFFCILFAVIALSLNSTFYKFLALLVAVLLLIGTGAWIFYRRKNLPPPANKS